MIRGDGASKGRGGEDSPVGFWMISAWRETVHQPITSGLGGALPGSISLVPLWLNR
jgi:hypothetical protein